jgi:ankyrin repeat protein
LGFEERPGYTVVRLRDLPLVKEAKKLRTGMQSAEVPPGLRRGVRPASGRAILHTAAGRGDAVAVTEIAENYPAFVNAQDENDRTPLWIACSKGEASVVKALLEAGGDPKLALKDGTTPLHVAASEGHLEMLKALHAHGAGLEDEKTDGETPIFAATRAKQGRVVAWLQVNGADVNHARKDAATPLSIAAEANILPIAMTLTALGAEVNALDVKN